MQKMLCILVLAILFLPIIGFSQVTGGDYYIPQGSNPQGYATLADAFNDINTNGVSGTVNLLIDANITEVGSNLILNRSDLTSTNNVVIKPAPGKTVTITIDGSGPLTINNTPYVTIDGSNNGSTTRDLTIYQSNGTSQAIHIYGNSDNFTLKNTIISYASNPLSANNWAFYCDVPSGVTNVPDNVLLDNNIFGSSGFSNLAAFYLSGDATANLYPSGWRITRNTFYGKLGGYAGFSVYNAGKVGTTFRIEENQFIGDNGNSGNTLLNFTSIEGDFYFERNRVHTFSGTVDNGTIYYLRLFSARDGGGNFYIINNFIGGNANNGAVAPYNYFLVELSASMNFYVYFNTFRQNALNVNSTNLSACLWVRYNTVLKDNIIIQDINASNAYALYVNGTLTSDYNNIVAAPNAFTGNDGGTNYKTLSDWQTGTGRDGNSTNVNVTFVDNALDFHLSGSSIGDMNLAGISISGITTDIDNQTRHATSPYKGADENTDNPLPVTLSSFVALPEKNAVRLTWKTESEYGNQGFILQRATSPDGPFVEIASYRNVPSLNGAENSSSPQQYEFMDYQVTNNTTYWYQLWNVDIDGTHHMLQTISTTVVLEDNPLTRNNDQLPQHFALYPNFPNPFNPITYIHFDIAETSQPFVKVKLEIFDMNGRKIRSLVDQFMEAGSYTIMWNGRDASGKPVASGQYFYRLSAGPFTTTKRLLLMK